MINPYTLKKYLSLLFGGMIPTICFYIGLLYYGFMGGLGFLFAGLLISVLLSVNLFLKNPFSDMLEGKGLLALDINSTGIIKGFIAGLDNNFIRGVNKKKVIEDVFDRKAVLQLQPPKKPDNKEDTVKLENGIMNFKLSENEYHKNKFILNQYPVLIYNSQIKSFMTKDDLAETEKDTYAEHGILYLNEKMRELTSATRDFGRYIVDQTRPKSEWYANKWVWIIAAVLVGILGVALAPKIIEVLTSAFSQAGGAIGGMSGAVVPRG